MSMTIDEKERLRRWRLILGKEASSGLGVGVGGKKGVGEEFDFQLGTADRGLDSSSPNVTRWLGDIRSYFPSSAVRVMQQDALQRLNLTSMLMEPEILETMDADVHLVATLLSLSKVIPEKTKDTDRQVVRKVVNELERKLANPLIEAVKGSLNKAIRNYRPRANEIDWDRTIRANLKNYLPDRGNVIAARLIG